jgi:hypothetical protein
MGPQSGCVEKASIHQIANSENFDIRVQYFLLQGTRFRDRDDTPSHGGAWRRELADVRDTVPVTVAPV